MQARSDLIAIKREIQEETCWIVKDPLRLQYYCYSDEAFFVLQNLSSTASFQRLALGFEKRFGMALSDDKLKSFLVQFSRDQLIGIGNGQDGSRLARQSSALKSQSRFRLLANPLAIRLPGWNFSPIFERLQGLSRGLVSPAFLLVIAGFALLALIIIFTHWSEFRSRLPSAQVFFQQQNLLFMLLCLGMTKIVHELGHALACRRWGAECHEIGVMFLLFTPCLYCDVSDAWMIVDKWKRIAIAAAGMLVEILMASIAALIWWYSEPGWLNSLCLNLMMICGVSTVLFNGNPLLRFDGYFILSDFLEVPNLWSRSRSDLRRWTNRWLLGVRESNNDQPPVKASLLLYAAASIVYRLLLITVILFLMVELLVAIHFEIIAVILIVLIGFAVFVLPALRFARRTVAMTYLGKIKKRRFILVWAGAAIISVLFFFVPLPHHITVPGFVEHAEVERVYTRTGGFLESSLRYGEPVSKGQVIFELDNPMLRLSELELRGEVERHRARLEKLEAIRVWNQNAERDIPAQVEKIRALEQNLINLESRLGALKVSAGQNGVLIVPFHQPADFSAPEEFGLPFLWTQQPLARKNTGAFLDKGRLVAMIGTPGSMAAFALLRQEKIDLVRSGQDAQVMIGDSPDRIAAAMVEEVSLLQPNQLTEDVRSFLDSQFSQELAQGELESGKLYLARLSIPSQFVAAQFESGRIRIRVTNSTLAIRVSRYLKRTFASLLE